MSGDSKGRAWYDKIYRKLETILVEVDNLASQGKDSLESSDSVKDEPEKLTDEQREGDRLKEKLSDSVLIDEKMLPSSSSLVDEHNDCNQTLVTCNDDNLVAPSEILAGDSNLIPVATEIQGSPVQNKVANTRSFSSNSMKVNEDDIEDSDIGPLDIIDLYDMTSREDPSDFDDNLLYATRDRAKQLRSFKRKIMDALTAKRRREKEYEQLAIWFGDANMSSDMVNIKEHATTSLDTKSSESNVQFVSEDSEWELL